MLYIAAYPGRFQVCGLHHVEIVRSICQYYNLSTLYVLVADWAERTKDNPLTAPEAVRCVELSIADLDVSAEICVQPFPLQPGVSFDDQFRVGLTKLGAKYVFSGSASTLVAARHCANELSLSVVELIECSSCHSSNIRQWIAQGDERWKGYVAPGAVAYLESLNLPERLTTLGEGAKRPWTS